MINFINDFELFNNEHLGSVRTAVDKKGQVWFVAKDICDVLEIKNNRMALSRLDEDEKGVSSIDTLGGKQSLGIINESGMYSLVLTSRKPQAKEFKKWLTGEVIPSIREHGGYIYGQEKLNYKDKTDLEEMINALSVIIDKKIKENVSLDKSVTKYKKRWHELVSEKNTLKSRTKQQKKEVKALNEYASVQEDMYNTLYEDFIKLYNENKKLQSKISKELEITRIAITSPVIETIFNKAPDYYINKEGLLISRDIYEIDRENEDFER